MATQGKPIDRATFLDTWKSTQNMDTELGVKWSPGHRQTAVAGYDNVSNTDEFILQIKDGAMKLYQPDPVDTLDYLAK